MPKRIGITGGIGAGKSTVFKAINFVLYNKEQKVSGGIGLIASRLTIEAPIKKDKSSFMISGRYSYAGHTVNTLGSGLQYLGVSSLNDFSFKNEIDFLKAEKIIFENALGENDMLVERNRQESVLFDFKKTFKLTDIKNNLGYTPTEVYVSFIFKNGNGLFDYPPKVGFKFNFHDNWLDNQFSGTTSVEKAMTGLTQTFSGKTNTILGSTYNYTGVTFTGGTTIPVGTTGLTGAFVEYNRKELKERIKNW